MSCCGATTGTLLIDVEEEHVSRVGQEKHVSHGCSNLVKKLVYVILWSA